MESREKDDLLIRRCGAAPHRTLPGAHGSAARWELAGGPHQAGTTRRAPGTSNLQKTGCGSRIYCSREIFGDPAAKPAYAVAKACPAARLFFTSLPLCPAPQDSNIQACLPLTFTPEEYEKQDIQLVAALSVTLGLFAVELAGFFSGVSMFNSTQSLISIGAHCSASVALSFFIFERWECTTYWYIFVFCSALPAVTEMALFISVFGLKKKPF
nr:PREDICTED: transmembrane protein 107 [Equus przewalskii]